MLLLFVTLLALSFGKTALACDMVVTAICDGGGSSSEISWEIKDQRNNVRLEKFGTKDKAYLKLVGGEAILNWAVTHCYVPPLLPPCVAVSFL